MRVTNSMLNQTFLYNLNNLENQLAQSENIIATGKTLNEPSDNPLAVAQDMTTRAAISQTNSYLSNINLGLTWMQNTSSSLQNLSSNLQSIRSTVLEALNGPDQSSKSTSEFQQTISQLTANAYQIIDTKQGDSYLFGGYRTSTAPSTYLQPQSTSLSSIDQAAVQGSIAFAVSDNIHMPVNVTGWQLFREVPQGGTSNLGATLTSIQADLTNTTALQNDLANLDANISNLTNAQTALGARVQQMNMLQSQTQQFASSLSQEKASLQAADMAKVMTQYSLQQTSYQAALQMGSQLLLPSLVKYL